MITIFQFPTSYGVPNTSPFCMKLETYCRMANLPFEIKVVRDPRKAPKGKLPFIKDGDMLLADSGIIIDYLKQKYGDTLDAHLTELQKAQNLAWQRLMEEHLYWTLVYSRWMDPVNWPIIKKSFFGSVPWLIRGLIERSVRKNIHQELIGHGIGRHSQDEIYKMGIIDLQAIHTQLANQAYFCGDQACTIDAILYSYLANILAAPIKSPIGDYVCAQQTFQEYCARMKERYFSNFCSGNAAANT